MHRRERLWRHSLRLRSPRQRQIYFYSQRRGRRERRMRLHMRQRRRCLPRCLPCRMRRCTLMSLSVLRPVSPVHLPLLVHLSNLCLCRAKDGSLSSFPYFGCEHYDSYTKQHERDRDSEESIGASGRYTALHAFRRILPRYRGNEEEDARA